MTEECGRRNNLGVPHLVVYGLEDDLQHVIAPSLEDAMVYAEYLANERNEQSFRVFELREVDMAVKRYYQVQLTSDERTPVGEATPGIVPPPGVAELTIVPEPDVDLRLDHGPVHQVTADSPLDDRVEAGAGAGFDHEVARVTDVRIPEAVATADIAGTGGFGGIELKRDRDQSTQETVRIFDLDELATAAAVYDQAPDVVPVAATGVGAVAGLSPESEGGEARRVGVPAAGDWPAPGSVEQGARPVSGDDDTVDVDGDGSHLADDDGPPEVVRISA